jgi:hypothetical protein
MSARFPRRREARKQRPLKRGHCQGKELSTAMSKEPEASNPLDPFGALNTMRDAGLQSWNAMRDASMQSWSKMMIDFVNSEAYSQATGQWLDTYLTMSQPFQRVIETTMAQVLAGLNMPTHADMTRLAEAERSGTDGSFNAFFNAAEILLRTEVMTRREVTRKEGAQ